MIDILKVIDNPLQDISLASVLMSDIYKIDDDELSFITYIYKNSIISDRKVIHDADSYLYDGITTFIDEKRKDYIIKYVVGESGTFGTDYRNKIKEVFPNLKLCTYSYLNGMNSKDIIEHQYDFIVLDELHRSGAPEWIKNVTKLLDNQNIYY